MTYFWLVLGMLALVAGAELLVRGAVTLAEFGRISPLVIGLTVVAFGTSAPEMAVSTVSSWQGNSAIAVGNVVGSNIFNVLIILGLSAVIVPLSVASQLVRFDVPLMIGISLLVFLGALNGVIDQWEGIVMLITIVAYTSWLIRASRAEVNVQLDTTAIATGHRIDIALEVVPPAKSLLLSLAQVTVGLVLLVIGAKWLVDSATMIATQWGVSEIIIGLTIVAAGTSLPELATSVVAAIKGQRDIAVGNVIGSNIFNLLAVLGLAATVSPSGVSVASTTIRFDMLVMVLVAVHCWPIFLSQRVVSRWEGCIWLTMYVLYTAILVMDAKNWPQADVLKNIFSLGLFPALVAAAFLLTMLHKKPDLEATH